MLERLCLCGRRLLPLVAVLLAAAPAPKQLAIVNAALHQYEGGPELGSTFEFSPGDPIHISFQIAGYQASPKSEIDLRYQMDAVDARDIPLQETQRGEFRTELAAEDKEWMPTVHQRVTIPPHAGPGRYRILIAAEDKLGGTQARKEIPVAVRGRLVEPSETLVVRNFRFLRAENDPQPLDPPVYRPGDTVWARFDLTGFRIGEKNRIDVRYGVAVANPAGKTLFSQPEAAVEQDAPFYAKRFVPGILSLSLDKDIRRGEYAIAVSAQDRVGNQEAESRHVFRIE